jgi:(1->4)-alpha-D-glucan 1-alpha-D-glucosylmutase
MEKATREAKRMTSWISPNEAFDKALAAFLEGICEHEPFLESVAEFVQPLIRPGRVGALAQVLLKLTAPGVPDLYQGTELWDLSLVDPDNRRPVDYELRKRLLSELPSLSVEEICSREDEGLPKLWLVYQALKTRRDCVDCFGRDSEYVPLTPHGSRQDHVVAFARGTRVVTVVPRLILSVSGDWLDTSVSLPDGTWKNQLTGEHIEGSCPVQELFHKFPVALLVREQK